MERPRAWAKWPQYKPGRAKGLKELWEVQGPGAMVIGGASSVQFPAHEGLPSG